MQQRAIFEKNTWSYHEHRSKINHSRHYSEKPRIKSTDDVNNTTTLFLFFLQAAALEAFMSPETQQHMVLADQAGSGKTLAYLLPLIQALKTEEAANGGPVTQPGRPRIVIVAPTVGETHGRSSSLPAVRRSVHLAGCLLIQHAKPHLLTTWVGL